MKVKVRIAVALDRKGNWNSFGCAAVTDDGLMTLACEDLEDGTRRYWLEAELDTPETDLTITPTITEAK